MEEKEITVNDKLIEEILQKKDQGQIVEPLDDLLSIEDILYTIQEYNEKIERYGDLRKKRTDPIDAAIDKAEDKVGYLKQIILETLKKFKEKNLSFPGLGRVVKKKGSSAWKVTDEQELLRILKDKNQYDSIVKEIPKISKKDLDKLLDNWKKSGEIPNCISEEPKPEGVSITFEKNEEESNSEVETRTETSDNTPYTKDNYDSI